MMLEWEKEEPGRNLSKAEFDLSGENNVIL